GSCGDGWVGRASTLSLGPAFLYFRINYLVLTKCHWPKVFLRRAALVFDAAEAGTGIWRLDLCQAHEQNSCATVTGT
ncbi:MAG: hypothetical protein Q8L60_06565, partial [Gammaproteobacteria bacterium]|nr:hypothetical protein [Gammaproteobacteria bacterium]